LLLSAASEKLVRTRFSSMRNVPARGAALVLALVAGAAADPARHHGSGPTTAQVTVVHVSADDCAPCRVWYRNHWPPFASSAEFSRITYREVKSPRLFDLLRDEYWPDDLRGYRQTIDRSSGAPLWLVIVDGEIVSRAWGVSAWTSTTLPAIASWVRR
jgi:hypothetical protein